MLQVEDNINRAHLCLIGHFWEVSVLILEKGFIVLTLNLIINFSSSILALSVLS